MQLYQKYLAMCNTILVHYDGSVFYVKDKLKDQLVVRANVESIYKIPK